MFVVISRFVVRNNMEREVREAFVRRPRLVDEAPGFLRMEVLCPQEREEEFWLVTWWRDEASYEAWHGSSAHKESHKAMPRGLKLVPGAQEIMRFVQVAD